MAKYKKKRARELKHDRFRDTTMLLADRMADRVAGRGRQILYVLLGLVVLAAAGYGIYRWRHKHNEEASAAMGRAIAIARAEITTTPPANPKDPVFDNSATIPAVAAERGLAVTAACEAITEMDKGRSGRSFTLCDTSAIIGKSE